MSEYIVLYFCDVKHIDLDHDDKSCPIMFSKRRITKCNECKHFKKQEAFMVTKYVSLEECKAMYKE